MDSPKYTHLGDGFEVRVFVTVIPDPPWVSHIEVRAERWDPGAAQAAWSRQITIRKLDRHSVSGPVFTSETVTLRADANAATGHGEYDDQVLVVRLADGVVVD